MENASQTSLIEQAKELSNNLGFSNGDTGIIEIRSTEDPKRKEMVLLQGSWDEQKPKIAIEQSDPKKVYVFLTAESFRDLVEALRRSNQENFNLKLEKAIWKHIPVDFDDVWVVAADKINKAMQSHKDHGSVNIDLDKLIDKLKREHPSLFINLADIDPSHKIVINPVN